MAGRTVADRKAVAVAGAAASHSGHRYSCLGAYLASYRSAAGNPYAYNMPNPDRPRRDRALYVEIMISAPIERVWELTQNPELHSRWDGRFSAIYPTQVREDGAQLFHYELALGVHTIRGTGVSFGERRAESGIRTSALVFDTEDWVSPLGTGRGYWRYVPCDGGVRFITGYDYTPGWGVIGRVLDPLLTRRFIWWLTAWSFDRLRIWAETDIPPECVRWWRGWGGGTRARARNCRSRPERRSRTATIMEDAPESLERIEQHGQ